MPACEGIESQIIIGDFRRKKGLPSVTPDGLIDGRMGSWPFHHSILTDGLYMISYAAVNLFAAHVSSPSLVIPAIESDGPSLQVANVFIFHLSNAPLLKQRRK
jgi:hypothetical protein